MEFETVLRGRRSVRAYSAEPLSDELIGEILSATPTCTPRPTPSSAPGPASMRS